MVNNFFRWLKNKLQDIWWAILHRTVHKFHVVKMRTLKPGYYDVDYRMLHACFQLLVDYVENEKPFDVIDWEHDPISVHVAKEIKDLYHWWKNVYPIRRLPIHDLDNSLIPPLSVVCRGQYDEFPAWEKAAKESHKLEDEWAEEEEKNLIRLMMIRQYLWT